MSELQKTIMKDALGVLPVYWSPTATDYTKQLKPGEQVLIINAHTRTDGVCIVTLPSKAEAVGRAYYVCLKTYTGTGTGDVSVYDKESATEITTYGALAATDDFAIYFCDGRKWRTWVDGVA
jgi:hypothetical protein